MSKTNWGLILGIGAAAVGGYYLISKGKGDDGQLQLPSISIPNMPTFSLPSMPQFSMPSMPQFSMPSMPQISMPTMPGLNTFAPGLSGGLDLQNPFAGMFDNLLPGLPGLPALPGAGAGAAKEPWNLWSWLSDRLLPASPDDPLGGKWAWIAGRDFPMPEGYHDARKEQDHQRKLQEYADKAERQLALNDLRAGGYQSWWDRAVDWINSLSDMNVPQPQAPGVPTTRITPVSGAEHIYPQLPPGWGSDAPPASQIRAASQNYTQPRAASGGYATAVTNQTPTNLPSLSCNERYDLSEIQKGDLFRTGWQPSENLLQHIEAGNLTVRYALTESQWRAERAARPVIDYSGQRQTPGAPAKAPAYSAPASGGGGVGSERVNVLIL